MVPNFDLVSHISTLVKLRKSGAFYIGPCPICGGRDRFNIKRGEDDLWICRKCGDGKYHSAIDFVMQYYKLDYKQALERMGFELPRRPLGKPRKPQQPAPVQIAPDSTWQAKAWTFIDAATSRLMSKAGAAAYDYLTQQRGISRSAMLMCTLGFARVYKRPAIVIPWLDVGDVVIAIKYRFIDALARNDKSKRFAMAPGSLPYLFGLQHVLPTDQTLLFVEGELNAISVLQALPRGVSIVSAGSDSNGNAALLRALAWHYRRAIIWTDEPAKALAIRGKMDRPSAKILKSPFLDGVKWDANEMLRAGLLAGFLSREFAVECQGVPVIAELAEA